MNDNKKINIYTIIIIIILSILGIIIFINLFSSKNETGKSNIYENIDYKTNSTLAYTEILQELLKPENVNQLYFYLDEDFMNNNNITEENLYDYLVNNGLISSTIEIMDCNIFENSNYNVYRFKYNGYLPDRYVNLIETEPFKYTLSFEENNLDNIIVQKGELYNSEYLAISIEDVTVADGGIKFSIKINNNTENDTIYIDLNDLYSIGLLMDENNSINRESVVVNEALDEYELRPNSNITVEAFFNVPEDQQDLIQGIIIRNFVINDTSYNAEFIF